MAVNPERGGAIMFLFVAVALFGALSYAFLQGSRTSMTMITNEADKAATYKSQDCTNAVNMAVKRLQTRGCAVAQISSDSTGDVGSGPTDGSCAVYHTNGGGVKGACAPPPAPADVCTTGLIGTVCTSDGAIYIGDIGPTRIYAAGANEGGAFQWKTSNTTTAGTSSTTDGIANTSAMIAAGAAAHPAANACNTKAPSGIWYLPAQDELNLVWTNEAAINLAAKGFDTSGDWYWSSTQDYSVASFAQRFNDGSTGGYVKNNASNTIVRCVRR